MRYLSTEYIKKMRLFIGKAIIRVNPTEDGDYCFMEKVVFLESINSKEIKISWDHNGYKKFGLASPYLDENWKPIEEILESPHPQYAALEGKWVKRVKKRDPSYTRRKFYDECSRYQMVTATKTHLFINKVDEKGCVFPFIIHTNREVGKGWILDPEFN